MQFPISNVKKSLRLQRLEEHLQLGK
jgi:hypothetical protein